MKPAALFAASAGCTAVFCAVLVMLLGEGTMTSTALGFFGALVALWGFGHG